VTGSIVDSKHYEWWIFTVLQKTKASLASASQAKFNQQAPISDFIVSDDDSDSGDTDSDDYDSDRDSNDAETDDNDEPHDYNSPQQLIHSVADNKNIPKESGKTAEKSGIVQ